MVGLPLGEMRALDGWRGFGSDGLSGVVLLLICIGLICLDPVVLKVVRSTGIVSSRLHCIVLATVPT